MMRVSRYNWLWRICKLDLILLHCAFSDQLAFFYPLIIRQRAHPSYRNPIIGEIEKPGHKKELTRRFECAGLPRPPGRQHVRGVQGNLAPHQKTHPGGSLAALSGWLAAGVVDRRFNLDLRPAPGEVAHSGWVCSRDPWVIADRFPQPGLWHVGDLRRLGVVGDRRNRRRGRQDHHCPGFAVCGWIACSSPLSWWAVFRDWQL